MKIKQQTLYRLVVIISALIALVIIGKADMGAVFSHHNFTIKPELLIMK
jgi:hypothetical protein